jgi:hypothetical protein
MPFARISEFLAWLSVDTTGQLALYVQAIRAGFQAGNPWNPARLNAFLAGKLVAGKIQTFVTGIGNSIANSPVYDPTIDQEVISEYIALNTSVTANFKGYTVTYYTGS